MRFSIDPLPHRNLSYSPIASSLGSVHRVCQKNREGLGQTICHRSRISAGISELLDSDSRNGSPVRVLS